MPRSDYYKPRGVPLAVLEQVTLTVDELEALRLTDLEGLYQADAAEKMNVSRQTLGRILESAHKKVADALVNGKALLIEGGTVELAKGVGGAQDVRPGFGRGGRGRGRGGRRRCGRSAD
jgi:predicted DNA-binding protein (UPF0251 family)